MIEGYREAGAAPGTHRGLPSPWLTVIVTLDEPLTIARHPDPRQPASQHSTLVGGLHTAPALITHDGRQSGVQLAVSPLALRSMFGVPAGQLAGIDLHGEELIGSRAAELEERVRAAGSWLARAAAVEQVLAPRVAGRASPRATVGPAPEVRQAWRRLLATGGRVRVRELAREVGWSTRHLSAQLRAETGLTPSAAARVIRFDRARRELGARARAGRALGLAELAATHGYYDQAHLTREFTELAGAPPARWAHEEFPSVQDRTERPAAGSRA